MQPRHLLSGVWRLASSRRCWPAPTERPRLAVLDDVVAHLDSSFPHGRRSAEVTRSLGSVRKLGHARRTGFIPRVLGNEGRGGRAQLTNTGCVLGEEAELVGVSGDEVAGTILGVRDGV